MSTVKQVSFGIGFNCSIHTNSDNYDLVFLSRGMGRYLDCFRNLQYFELSLSWLDEEHIDSSWQSFKTLFPN
jgi:hypothetical protein